VKSRAGIVAVWAFAVWAPAGFALGVAAVAFGSPSINSNIFTKLQVADRAQAIVRAQEARMGLQSTKLWAPRR
jgi:hypothetical protein